MRRAATPWPTAPAKAASPASGPRCWWTISSAAGISASTTGRGRFPLSRSCGTPTFAAGGCATTPSRGCGGGLCRLPGHRAGRSRQGGYHWQAVAVGDTCLFHSRRGALVRAFPVDRRKISATPRRWSAPHGGRGGRETPPRVARRTRIARRPSLGDDRRLGPMVPARGSSGAAIPGGNWSRFCTARLPASVSPPGSRRSATPGSCATTTSRSWPFRWRSDSLEIVGAASPAERTALQYGLADL